MVPHREPPPGLSPWRGRAKTAAGGCPSPGQTGAASALSEGHLGGVKNKCAKPWGRGATGRGDREVSPSSLSFFFLFRRSNASLLWMTPITTFFFFSVIFGAMLASSTATRSEKSLTRAGRKVLVLSGALCPCRAGAGARQQQPRCLGTFDGARPFPALPTRDGERRSHRTALSHLPKLQPRVPQPQAGQTLQPLPRPPKGAHNTPFAAQRERLSAFTCL